MPDTRSRVLAAAAAEFADRGFAGAGVDRIARRARLTKGMIYYHFKNKAALYREVLQLTIQSAADRVGEIARSDLAPADKVRAFVTTVLAEVGRQPHFPRILLREIAEQGRHLDADTMTRVQALPRVFREILQQHDGGSPRPHPHLLYISLVSPILFYMASAPVRATMAAHGLKELDGATPDVFTAHIQWMASLLLEARADSRSVAAPAPHGAIK